MLQVHQLTKYYHNADTSFAAVKNVSFTIAAGESIGLLGRSGSGKSTLARLIAGLTASDCGCISLNNQNINLADKKNRRNYYRQVQYIFQEPAASFHPFYPIGQAIMEPLLHNGYTNTQAKKRLQELLEQTDLPLGYSEKYIYQLSGGEAQRAAIARAISIHPQLLICDEITSALDTLTQQKIINLLLALQKEYKTALLFITHDISLAADFCQRLLIMDKGSIVEAGTAQTIMKTPQHPATQQLLLSAHNLNI